MSGPRPPEEGPPQESPRPPQDAGPKDPAPAHPPEAAPGEAPPDPAHPVPMSSETAFRLLVQSVLDYGIFMLDPGGHISSWNAGAERIKGYRAEEITGKHFSVFYPPEDIAARKPYRELEIAVAEGRLEDEGWRIRKDGTRFWANVVITALFDESGVLRGFGKVTRDMTERRAAEQELSDRRRLFAHLVQAQEMERRRIAWDVHDDSIQSMVAVGMRLQLLADQAPEPYARELARLDASVREAVTRLRDLTFRLHPPGIDRHGLVESLALHLEDVVGGWGLASEFTHGLRHEPAPETAITVFRIVQEALLNVRKHARAATVRLELHSVDGGLLTRVIDDGNGKGLAAHAVHPHFGVMEMRERAETAGGWWTIRGVAGTGTTVEFWVPDLPAAPTGPLTEADGLPAAEQPS
ncbi:PAS domain-containing sensor histidine kinase [Actinacidiphila sp. ITFR-21]|uniref:PAS domain-containing sensor histidine kinase n=1 Tax=Actinacidiphila sp. ITFR-21 TaxID=3075199 RepID=UPI00288BC6D1|nr:PAS domain S-box protein [Streptomyces sp. ITFR-21]WNI14144.1 PAS domain S-box protein [Streptomyces sp. ITFR-21]